MHGMRRALSSGAHLTGLGVHWAVLGGGALGTEAPLPTTGPGASAAVAGVWRQK